MRWLPLYVLFLSACTGADRELYPPGACEEAKTIYIVSHGWHTGFVIDAHDLHDVLVGVKQDFAGAEYIEIGWGNKTFYQAENITFGLALRALFSSSESILHVVGLMNEPDIVFPASEVIRVQISSAGYYNLLSYLDRTFRKKDGRLVRIDDGLYGWSRFYAANGDYHIFNTCNNWVATGLRQTGFPITDTYAATAGNVMYQVSQYAHEPLTCSESNRL